MTDLLYVGSREDYDSLWAEMQKFWPDAVLEDASDFIHHYRFSIDIPDVDLDEYLLVALNNGFFDCSFIWQMMAKFESEKALAMMKLVTAYKRGKDG